MKLVTITGIHTMPTCIDTVWLFDATDGVNELVVAVDHQPATDIYGGLCRASQVEAEVQDWQIIERKVAS